VRTFGLVDKGADAVDERATVVRVAFARAPARGERLAIALPGPGLPAERAREAIAVLPVLGSPAAIPGLRCGALRCASLSCAAFR